MKITKSHSFTHEEMIIEATPEELRASNSLADGFLNILRTAFNPSYEVEADDDEADDQEEGE